MIKPARSSEASTVLIVSANRLRRLRRHRRALRRVVRVSTILPETRSLRREAKRAHHRQYLHDHIARFASIDRQIDRFLARARKGLFAKTTSHDSRRPTFKKSRQTSRGAPSCGGDVAPSIAFADSPPCAPGTRIGEVIFPRPIHPRAPSARGRHTRRATKNSREKCTFVPRGCAFEFSANSRRRAIVSASKARARAWTICFVRQHRTARVGMFARDARARCSAGSPARARFFFRVSEKASGVAIFVFAFRRQTDSSRGYMGKSAARGEIKIPAWAR